MSLETTDPDMLMMHMATRSEELEKAETLVAELKPRFEAYESAAEIALRDGVGAKSMAEAEKRVRADENWVAMYEALMLAHVAAAEAKRAYRRAEMAIDLYRTVQATVRAIER